MLKSMPKNMDLWDQYGAMLLNFNRHVEGDRERAQRRAAEFVRANYEALHEGAEATWEWAYEWDTDDPIELSAVHHGMTFFYEEGEEAFNYECQCKVDIATSEEEAIKALPEQIVSRVSHLPRRKVPAQCKVLVTHVDCNADFLSYMTVASDNQLMPYVIDYGTYPPQPGVLFKKGKILRKLSDLYQDIEREDFAGMMYQAVRDFSEILGNTIYVREDSHELTHRYIAFDTMWQTDHVLRAIRECRHRTITLGTQGVFYGVKDRPMMENTSGDRQMHYHCYTTPSQDRVIDLLKIDTNSMKTLVHRGFIARSGAIGTYKVFIPENPGDHQLFAEHLCAEEVHQMVNQKEQRIVNEWVNTHNHDNEFLDNLVGCTALLFKAGCTLKSSKEIKRFNIQQYVRQK
jgi:phage terminase large subunit GpA-like protein